MLKCTMNYVEYIDYIDYIDKRMCYKSKCMEKDLVFVKKMLNNIQMYGTIGWYENNKLNEVMGHLKKVYPKSVFN